MNAYTNAHHDWLANFKKLEFAVFENLFLTNSQALATYLYLFQQELMKDWNYNQG